MASSKTAHESSHPWWVRLCDRLWKISVSTSGFIIFSLLGGVFVSWITSPNGVLPANSPFIWLIGLIGHEWLVSLAIAFCFLILALFFKIGSQWPTQEAVSSLQESNIRTRMLERFRANYQEILDQSLKEIVWKELNLASQTGAVENAASLLLRLSPHDEKLLSPDTSILDVYEKAAQELLILGNPGTGKSTLLVQLAQQLIEQASQDNTQPLPVYLRLSTWATKRSPFQIWLVECIAQFYKLPKQLVLSYIQDKKILLLLDGLDEVEGAARTACIDAINAYHQEYPGPLVVCSRKTEYEAASRHKRLGLQRAVVVQPFSEKQVNAILMQAGKSFDALRREITQNAALKELARVPLMLNVLMLTYRGTGIRTLPQKSARLQQQVWTEYFQRMVAYKGDGDRYPLGQSERWLHWLAQQMQQRNETTLFLERLQPDWLPKRQQFFYRCCVVLVFNLLSIIGAALAWMLVYGLLFGLLGGLTKENSGHFLEALLGSLPLGVLPAICTGLIFGLRSIQPHEVLTWSWADIRSKLFVGVLAAFTGGLAFILSKRLAPQISGMQLIDRQRLSPNEGMKRSVKNGLRMWLLLSPLTAVLYGATSLLTELLLGLPVIPFFLVLQGVFYALFGGLIIGLFFGLGAFIQHYILRFWLWRIHAFPWQAVRFLDDATARILLRHASGGYEFVHRLLLDFFAGMLVMILAV